MAHKSRSSNQGRLHRINICSYFNDERGLMLNWHNRTPSGHEKKFFTNLQVYWLSTAWVFILGVVCENTNLSHYKYTVLYKC